MNIAHMSIRRPHTVRSQLVVHRQVQELTNTGMLLNRILVKRQTPEDLAIVHVQQDQMLFTPKARGTGPHKGIPPLDLQIFSNLADSSDIGQTVLSLTTLVSRYNQSEVLSDRAWIVAALEKAGISPDVPVHPRNLKEQTSLSPWLRQIP